MAIKQFNLSAKYFDEPIIQLGKDGNPDTYHTHGNGWYLIETQEEVNLISASITGGGVVWEEDGKIKCSGRAPSESHEWINGKWVINPSKEIEMINTLKEALLAQAVRQADELKRGLLAGYPDIEIESFYKQEKEARDYLEDKTKDTPLLSEICRLRRLPLDVLVGKVIAKADALTPLTGSIIGGRQHFEDLIHDAKTPEQLREIGEALRQWHL